MTIVVVSGSRRWQDQKSIFTSLEELNPSLIVHGAARGVDTIAASWAHKRNLPVLSMPAQWAAVGRTAGAVRNLEMLRAGHALAGHTHNLLVAGFPLPSSVGTFHCMREAAKRRMPVYCWHPLEKKLLLASAGGEQLEIDYAR